MAWEDFLAAGVASGLTLFEMDKTSYVPAAKGRRWALRGWQPGFVAINGGLAFGIAAAVRDAEFLYESAKGFFYRRINDIVKVARSEEAVAYAATHEVDTLVSEAKLSVDQDALSTPEQKRRAKAWILRTLKDAESTDMDRKLAPANFILSGQQGSD